MAYKVLVTDTAFEDLDNLTEYIRQNSSLDQARKWFAGTISAIHALREMPERCSVAEESRLLNQEVRILHHGRRNRA